MKRRSFLKATAAAAAGSTAGCIGGGDGDSEKPESSEEFVSAGDMEWMERYDDTWAEFAENSAQMHVEDYNRDMQMSGNHVDSAPELGSVDNSLIDESSLELVFGTEDSGNPGDRYNAELRMKTNSDSVLSDFGNYDGNENLYQERVAQLFGSVMMPTVGTLFTDSVGPDFRSSQAEADENAVTGIDYVLEDNNGNEERISYGAEDVDQLSETYESVTNQKEEFYDQALEDLS